VLFVAVERRATEPILPVRRFEQPRDGVGLVAAAQRTRTPLKEIVK
jgi:hypothetical protein